MLPGFHNANSWERKVLGSEAWGKDEKEQKGKDSFTKKLLQSHLNQNQGLVSYGWWKDAVGDTNTRGESD